MGKRKNLLVFNQITRDFLTEVFFLNSYLNHPYLFPSFFSPFRAQTFSVQLGLSAKLAVHEAGCTRGSLHFQCRGGNFSFFFLPSPCILPSFLKEIKFLSTPPATC